MSLVDHAERELQRAGLFDVDSDYDGMIGEEVLRLVRAFAKGGHSGYSAHVTLDVFGKVARFQALTPIDSNPDDWMAIAEDVAGNNNTWQSRRQPELFSHDGGKTWHSVDDPRWHRKTPAAWLWRRRIRKGQS